MAKLGTPIHVNEVTTIAPRCEGEPCHLSLELAMLNHSCRPNCHFVFDGFRFYVHANRNIERGEQLTIRYDDPFSTLRIDMDRRAYKERLWSRYQIKCAKDCICGSDLFWTAFETIIASISKFRNIMEPIETWKKENSAKAVSQRFGDCIPKARKKTMIVVAKKFFSQALGVYTQNTYFMPLNLIDLLCVRYILILEDMRASQCMIDHANAKRKMLYEQT